MNTSSHFRAFPVNPVHSRTSPFNPVIPDYSQSFPIIPSHSQSSQSFPVMPGHSRSFPIIPGHSWSFQENLFPNNTRIHKKIPIIAKKARNIKISLSKVLRGKVNLYSRRHLRLYIHTKEIHGKWTFHFLQCAALQHSTTSSEKFAKKD